jgi:hypothetical protein
MMTLAPSAQDRALGTNVLLEQILTNLPRKSIYIVKRVSQGWRQMTITSPELLEAAPSMALMPLNPTLPTIMARYVHARMEGGTPRYDVSDGVVVNAVLESQWVCTGERRFHIIKYGQSVPGLTGAVLDEFVTQPPCSAIGLKLFDTSTLSRDTTETVVYVPTGVRIRDVTDTANILVLQQGSWPLPFSVEGGLAIGQRPLGHPHNVTGSKSNNEVEND